MTVSGMTYNEPDRMTVDEMADAKRLVKSAERVRDLGEVFTPTDTVNSMLDMLPEDVWRHHPSETFLEPACGDGNFLVAVLQRKLDAIADAHKAGELAAGASAEAVAFHAIETLASIYAVDISKDNVIGGTPGHEIGARQRLVTLLREWYKELLGRALDEHSPLLLTAQWIVDRNVLIGNMLPFDPDGSPSGRDNLPILVYAWEPSSKTVTIERTTLGAVTAEVEKETVAMASLFGPPEPEHVWTGLAIDVCTVGSPAPTCADVPSRNGFDRRIGSSR